MASAELDALATARELRDAGIEAAHAEAIVSAASRATAGLLTESRFEAAMAEQRAYMDQRLAEQRAYMDQRLAEQRAYMEKRLDRQDAYLDKRLAEQTAYLDKRLAEQDAAIVKREAAIYRYLWLHGSMIVMILSALYALVESWSRGAL